MPICATQVAEAEAANCGFKMLSYLLYPARLAPSDFFLFLKLKSHLLVAIVKTIIWSYVMKEFLEDQKAFFFRDRSKILEHRRTKCIDIKATI